MSPVIAGGFDAVVLLGVGLRLKLGLGLRLRLGLGLGVRVEGRGVGVESGEPGVDLQRVLLG